MAIIQIQDVSKKFQTKDGEIDALKHVTLDIEAGDIYGIIGMSGAGKSTLVRCINHIEVPTEGTVIVQDKDLSKLSEKELRKQREHIGMIFQHFNLLMQKSVLETAERYARLTDPFSMPPEKEPQPAPGCLFLHTPSLLQPLRYKTGQTNGRQREKGKRELYKSAHN